VIDWVGRTARRRLESSERVQNDNIIISLPNLVKHC
jgi:hypothetical protein